MLNEFARTYTYRSEDRINIGLGKEEKEVCRLASAAEENQLDSRTHAAVCRGEAEAAQSSLISRRAVTHLWGTWMAAGGSGVRGPGRRESDQLERLRVDDSELELLGVISAKKLHWDTKTSWSFCTVSGKSLDLPVSYHLSYFLHCR